LLNLQKLIVVMQFLWRFGTPFALISLKSQIFIKTKEMKKLIITSILALLIASATTVRAQDYPREYLGLPGDNFNLYAVMDLFRNSETLEDFERSLNDPDSRINNLDLNGDNFVDYITVSDYVNKKVHTIVLRALLGRNEYQDIAVFTVQKMRRKKVMIQLIGDAALYGRNYVIEPALTKKRGQRFYADPVYAENATVINNYYWDIFDWPVAMHICRPRYNGWHSSWYWGYYPGNWNPWRPYYWDYYYGYHSGWTQYYHNYYTYYDHPRYNRYNEFYYNGIRQQSSQVNHKIAEGSYNVTYSRPEQRVEGAALYNRIHTSTGNESRRTSGTTVDSRRTSSPVTTRRSAADSRTEEQRTAVSRDAETIDNEARDNERRATESRANEARESERRAAESRANEARESERRAAESRANEALESERRAAESRANESRESERRAAESRANESRESERRAAESRANESRESERRAAESRANEARESDRRAAESRANEARDSERRSTESRANEARDSERRSAESRANEAMESERRAAETRRSESNTTSGSRIDKPNRRE
jgi:hypothetical protein